MAKRPTKRDFVNIIRPGTELDSRGNPTGNDDATLAEDVPCAIIERRGREDEFGRQLAGTKEIQVELFTDPTWGLKSRDHFIVQGSGRRLEIIEVRDPRNVQREVVCTVGEITD